MRGNITQLAAALADRYRIERELGAGGMATVFLAQDIRHDRQVAIKVLRRDLAVELGAERFLREIKTTANLRHARILPLFDSGEAAGSLFYVMPYIAGETLRDRIDRERQLPMADAIEIACEVADALAHAHAAGVIHRDIKPANILLQNGHAVVADFGIARAISMAEAEKITASGVAVGTPTYMSPEQAAGEVDLDGRSDVYALGCVLYEMLGGQPPFTGVTAAIVTRQHLTIDAPPLTNARPGTPPSIVAAVRRSLAKTPADRFQSVADFAVALRADEGTGTSPFPAPAPVPHRRSLPLALAVSGLVLVAVVAAVLRWRGAAATANRASVAVLPFDDLSPDHANGYLGDGIAETLINALANVAGLQVSGRTSSFSMRDRAADVPEIGRRLGVATVLEGSVQRAGDQLRITAQLIRAANGMLLWSQTFDRTAKDIFAVQDSVARAVVTALQGRVLARGDTALTAQGTGNPAAYDAYLMGRHFWGRRTTNDMVQAARYFARAIALDSSYARAWSGLADSYTLFIPAEYNVPGVRTDSMLDLAERAARHSVALDPGLGEAWSSLGEVLEYRNKWVEARQAFEKGVQLAPNYPTAHQWYGYDLAVWNRWDDAIREMERARQLDPLSLVIVVSLAATYDGVEQWQPAAAAYGRAEALEPNHPLVTSLRFQHDLMHGDAARWAADARGRAGDPDSVATEAIARQLADPAHREAGLRALAKSGGPYFQLVVARMLDGDSAVVATLDALRGGRDLDKVNAFGVSFVLGSRLRASPRVQAALQRIGYPRY